MEPAKKVSVIIPVYNGEKFVGEAIESVLGQSIKPAEIIVVNDGSEDTTEIVLKKFKDKIRYVYKENGGTASARNCGLRTAQGELIGFLDADDIWLENKLERQLQLFHENPEYEIVLGLLKRIPISKTEEALKINHEDGEYAVSAGSSLIKRKVFDIVGTFDEEMGFCEDVDLFLRILDSEIKVFGHKDVVQFYRRHDQNITLDKNRSFHDLLRVFKKTVDRRRKAGKDLPDLAKMGAIMEFWQS